MKDAFVNICNVPTHIYTKGRWIEESLDNEKEIAICITGNPGVPGFYTEFIEELYQRLECKMPVWVIGHMGHDDPPATSIREVPQLKGNEELFDLNAQIRHKIEFIKKYIPQDCKIHLIGHSIGAWMILQMLENDYIRQAVIKCYMLFPTVERMIESQNGWVFTKIALPMYWIFGFLIVLFNRLPVFIRMCFIHLYFLLSAIPSHFRGAALCYSKASVVEKVIFLAEDEMARVRFLQTNIIEQNLNLLTFYYGTTDGWVPVEYFNGLKKEFPEIDAQLDTKKIDHAFVLRYSKPMGGIVSNMIVQNSTLF
ncbi:lipid droplet-associated hydrolase-like [Teleopsis dalmanni]|uniref:lipid droplet-associated hydrolase-like n=1 Tax=Teleopsis dalmanni TaxID=139649 RepID=UPI0018CDF1BD|nr:lipid droplet-associated hydrolase-like [Teleopsis dalmanni]